MGEEGWEKGPLVLPWAMRWERAALHACVQGTWLMQPRDRLPEIVGKLQDGARPVRRSGLGKKAPKTRGPRAGINWVGGHRACVFTDALGSVFRLRNINQMGLE